MSEQHGVLWLGNLPKDEFIHILEYLEPSDIVHLGLSCRELQENVQVGHSSEAEWGLKLISQ